MGLTTSTTLTNIINEVLLPKIHSTFHQNNALFNIWSPVPHSGGAYINWPIPYGPATNYAATYSEGDPAPNPNIETVLKGSIAKQPFQVAASISNVGLDYLVGNDIGMDALLFDLEMKSKELLDLVNTTLLASLEAGVDSTGTYTGNDASVYTGLASYESAVSGVLTLAALEDMWEALLDNDRAVAPQNIVTLGPQNQLTNYVRLAAGASNFPLNSMAGAPIDGGRQIPGTSFNGQPFYGIPDMTDTVILMGDKNVVSIYETRPVTIEEKSVQADEKFFLITCNYQIVCHNPQKWGKLTGVTA